MSQKKITKELEWKELSTKFTIGNVSYKGKSLKVNELEDAIKDGTLAKMVQEAADKLHGGDTHAVYTQLGRNLSSWLCNSKKADYKPNAANDQIRYNLLKDFVDEGMKNAKVATGGSSKAYWQFSLKEINSITEFRVAKSVYDCIASYKQKYVDKDTQKEVYDELTDRQKAARVMMNSLKPAEPAVDQAVVDKLKEALSDEEFQKILSYLKK